MKRITTFLAGFALAISAAAATLSPIQLLNPAGSTAGQAIVSTGASTAPAWGNVTATALAPVGANTVIGNFTASSASPLANAVPSCSTANSALKYTSGTGLVCGTAFALTSGNLSQFAATTSAQLAGVLSDETGSGNVVFSASPIFTGTVTVANITASGTLTGFPGRLIGVQRFTANGTYTPTAGTTSVIVEIQAGGGAGGGTVATGASVVSVGAGGNAGGYIRHRMTSGFSGATVVVGAGGTPASGAIGGNGGASSFAGITAGGGNGGPSTTAAANAGQMPSVIAGTATGGSIVNIPGAIGGPSFATFGTFVTISGNGANSPLGSGGGGGIQTNGTAGVGFGAGGGGTANGQSQPAISGGAGSPGIVIVYEFS